MDFTQEQLEQIIQTQFNDVVPELREYILSAELAEIVTGMCEEYNISDQENAVHNEATLMLLGILSPEGLPERLVEEIGIPADAAESLATDMFEIILTERLGLIPAELSPNIDDMIAEPEPEEPKESPILQATRTMQGDIAEAKNDDAPRWGSAVEEASGVEKKEPDDNIPRYSKPITDTPKYE